MGSSWNWNSPSLCRGAGRKLNGAGSFSGTLAPDVGGLRYADGTLLIDPYATFIHEEADGVIRGTWLVTRSELEGESWQVEGRRAVSPWNLTGERNSISDSANLMYAMGWQPT